MLKNKVATVAGNIMLPPPGERRRKKKEERRKKAKKCKMFLMRTLLTLMVPEYLIWPQRQTPAERATKGGGGGGTGCWEIG